MEMRVLRRSLDYTFLWSINMRNPKCIIQRVKYIARVKFPTAKKKKKKNEERKIDPFYLSPCYFCPRKSLDSSQVETIISIHLYTQRYVVPWGWGWGWGFRGLVTRGIGAGALLRSATCRSMKPTSRMNTIIRRRGLSGEQRREE